MKNKPSAIWLILIGFSFLFVISGDGRIGCQTMKIGLFEESMDIGNAALFGSVHYDSDQDEYTVAGSGENMWFDTDSFHFVWKTRLKDYPPMPKHKHFLKWDEWLFLKVEKKRHPLMNRNKQAVQLPAGTWYCSFCKI